MDVLLCNAGIVWWIFEEEKCEEVWKQSADRPEQSEVDSACQTLKTLVNSLFHWTQMTVAKHILPSTAILVEQNLVWSCSLRRSYLFLEDICSALVIQTVCCYWGFSIFLSYFFLLVTFSQQNLSSLLLPWKTSNVTGCHRGPKQKLRAG